MKNRKVWIGMGFAAGTMGAAWLIHRRRQSPAPWRFTFPALVKIHGEETSHWLMAQAESRYRALLAKGPLLQNRALRQHLTGSILPGLALYQVLLEEHNGDQQSALDEIDQIFDAWVVGRMGSQMALLRRMPFPFRVFRAAFDLRMRTGFPEEGWETTWLEHSNQRIAFDMHRCFYLDTLTAFGAPELTPHFCRGDDVMAEMLPPSIGYQRTTTLGRGGERCDFRYWSKEPD